MKIEEIFKVVQEGKTVKFNEGIYRMEGIWLVRIFKGEKTKLFSTTHMGADNFEIVEEEKTLSDKIVKSYPSAKDLTHYKDCCYEEDVNQFIKDIKEDKVKKEKKQMEGMSNSYIAGMDYMIERINKRAGERLV